MHEILQQIDEYLQRYEAEFIMACKRVQQLDPPEWARSACFWLQMYDEFEDHLPFCLIWRNGSDCDAETNDPTLDVHTEPWMPDWPETGDISAMENAAEKLVGEWVRACWIRSGGRSHPMRFYVHFYSTGEDYCLLRGRTVSEEEIERDTGCD